MRHSLICAMLVFLGWATALSAQDSVEAKADQLFATIGFPQILEVMRAEGLVYGDAIAEEMFPGRAGPDWQESVSSLYSVDAMFETMRVTFADRLKDSDIDRMQAFYDTDLGRRIINLELSAREAMLAEDIEEASKESAILLAEDDPGRHALITDFINANDLIEVNVVGGLNANYAFYTGLIDGGAFGADVSPERALNEVWSQEEAIRQDTTEWLYAFFALAYAPLSDDDLQTYIDFARTDNGQRMTWALFVAFDDMLEELSRGLGLAAAQVMAVQEL